MVFLPQVFNNIYTTAPATGAMPEGGMPEGYSSYVEQEAMRQAKKARDKKSDQDRKRQGKK